MVIANDADAPVAPDVMNVKPETPLMAPVPDMKNVPSASLTAVRLVLAKFIRVRA